MNLDDKGSITFPFVITLAKVSHSRGVTFLVLVGLQKREKLGRLTLIARLPELTNQMQSQIRERLRNEPIATPSPARPLPRHY